MKSIMIATPAMGGQVSAGYAVSLADTMLLLRSKGYTLDIRIHHSGSLLVAERNRLVEEFWKSDSSHLFCIDADVGWTPYAALALAEKDEDFVAGIYPSRYLDGTHFVFRPKFNDNGTVNQKGGMLAMECVPAGFMLLSRRLIGGMRDAFPNLRCEPKDTTFIKPHYCFFNTEVIDGDFWGEDYTFCRRATEAGFEIWCDPAVELTHAGKKGRLIDQLKLGE